jgi:hypothetical protein
MSDTVPRSILRMCVALCVLASIAAAGDLNVIIGFKGDADASVVKKHPRFGDRAAAR